MENPAFDARREAERAEAEKEKASSEAAQAAFEALTAFMRGKASFSVLPNAMGAGGIQGWIIRLNRDANG